MSTPSLGSDSSGPRGADEVSTPTISRRGRRLLRTPPPTTLAVSVTARRKGKESAPAVAVSPHPPTQLEIDSEIPAEDPYEEEIPAGPSTAPILQPPPSRQLFQRERSRRREPITLRRVTTEETFQRDIATYGSKISTKLTGSENWVQ